MGGGENVGERGWWRWCFLSLLCGTLDRKGVSMRRNGARRTSSRVPPTPTTLYTQVTGAHQPDKVGRPRSGRVRGKNGSSRWTRSLNVGDHPNILPLDLNFTLYFILYSFHHGSVYRACFIVTARLPIESDSHYTLFYFETNSITFGPLMIQES
jgi:hypothetical protein